jgi:WD40 repeat protein
MEEIKKDSTVSKEKSSKKKVLIIAIVALVVLLIVGSVIARPEILQGNFDLDYLLFRDSTQEEKVEKQATEKEDEDENEDIQTEPLLMWSITTKENEVNTGINSIAISPDGETVAIGEYLTTHIYHLHDGELEQLLMYEHSVDDLSYSPDGKILAGGQGLYGTLLLDIETGEEIYQLDRGYNNYAHFSPDGKNIATGNRAGDVWIWDTENGQKVSTLDIPDGDFMASIEYHPDGNILATTNWDGYAYIFDIENKSLLEKINLDILTGGNSNLFRFSPNGEIMAGYMKEENQYFVRIWDVESFEKIKDITAPRDVRDITFSPDGKLIATSSFSRVTIPASDSVVTIYDVESGEPLYSITKDSENEEYSLSEADGKIRPVVAEFTNDGGHIVIAWDDSTLELWRLPGGEPIAEKVRDIKNPPPLPSDVLFEANESVLKETASVELDNFAEELYAGFKKAKITFIGHTTSYAEQDFNIKLSSDRASAVKSWFENWAKDNNVTGWDLYSEGKGSSELKVPDRDAEGNFIESAGTLNRRVDILIEELD